MTGQFLNYLLSGIVDEDITVLFGRLLITVAIGLIIGMEREHFHEILDNAISKTINIPQEYSFDDFQSLYETAFDKGLKGCTVFRPNPITGQVLETASDEESRPFCCHMEREAD